jgi:hypothetical protein
MASINNPVSRLHEILSQLFEINSTQSMIIEKLDLFQNNSQEVDFCIFEQVAQIIDLALQAQQAIKSIDHLNNDLYLAPLADIKDKFTYINLHESLNAFKSRLKSDTMTRLSYCADALSRESNEKVLEPDEILELLNSINTLQEKLLKSEINDFLKSVFLEKLEEIRLALINYKVHGIKGLRRPLESSVGALILYQEDIKLQDVSSKDFWEELMKFLTKVNTLVSLGNNIPLLGGKIVEFIQNLMS